METVIVLFIIAMAAVYVIRKFAKPLQGKGSACSCGGSCSSKGPTLKTKGKLVPFNPRAVGPQGSAQEGCGCSQGGDCDCGPEDSNSGMPTTRLQ